MADSDFLVGEPLALDLVNTRALVTAEGGVELLASLDNLESWLSLEAERLPARAGIHGLTDRDLAAIRKLRDAVSRLIDEGRNDRKPDATSLATLNSALEGSSIRRTLRCDDGAMSLQEVREGTAGERLLGVLADAAAQFLSQPDIRLIRQCAADDCTMLFVATNQRRRWCSSERCGNRARVARYYHSHKD